jgi:hypothetical protein
MAKKELRIVSCPEIKKDSAFIRHFQTELLLLLKKRGKLTETQYGRALALLSENKK